ncbi:CLUMA_CG016028, isoform A [Clunio marinus]|uniref:CLUMA_CG016028, isoform A n=1 Tax=Clunio marinus TaxID=568069 RepID=A0A1J1IRT8_9DIPT|nr:CLUMA_CG016028, isoform A [Clunio marinus]
MKKKLFNNNLFLLISEPVLETLPFQQKELKRRQKPKKQHQCLELHKSEKKANRTIEELCATKKKKHRQFISN